MPWFVPMSLLLTIYSSPLLQLPVPEGSSTPSLIVSVMQPGSHLPHPQHITSVLLRHSLPINVNVKYLLAGFYAIVEQLIRGFALDGPALSLPFPLLDTNQVYIMGTLGLRRVMFEDDIFLNRFKSGPWRTFDLDLAEGESVDMGEWTRFKAFFLCELF